MNDFNPFLKKLWDWIEYFIGLIASIMSVLCFFGIDYSKIKPFIMSAMSKFKKQIRNAKKYIIYKRREVKVILFKQYLNIIKMVDRTICYSEKILFPLLYCCVLLSVIYIYNPFDYLDKVWNIEVIVNKNDFNQTTLNSYTNYYASNNTGNQFNKKSLNDNNVTTAEPRVRDGYKLELEYPEDHPKINNDNFEKLYNSIFYTNEKYLDEIIQNEIDILKNSRVANISLEGAAASEATICSEIENDLFYKNDKPISSDELEQIIMARTELSELYPNGTLNWLLANSYQTFAYNYLNQTDSSKSILYFYMQSIYYAKKSLEFDLCPEDKEIRIKYIQMRYKDIANCNVLDDEVRFRANEIYYTIEN